jgi:NAD(P)-dependent dehydrogenase (short-subunit alcohol dehydrogenase family)
MPGEFEGQRVIVTGAAGALGHAVATAFAQRGADLVLFDIDQQRLSQCHADAPAGTVFRAVELADTEGVRRAVAQVLSGDPRIDVLCNIAGGFGMGPAVHETPPALWQQMLDSNANSVLNMMRAVVPAMLAAGRGRIVNVGAGAAVKAGARAGAYAASKSIVLRLTEAASAELREQGINVNCVLPSIIDTPANRAEMPDADFSRWVAPADLAAVICFLCSDAARAVHGAALPVSGLV